MVEKRHHWRGGTVAQTLAALHGEAPAEVARDRPGPAHVEKAIDDKRFHVGATMSAKDGRSYTIDKLTTYRNAETLTLRRTEPKMRGKAARKAEKQQRRRERESQQARRGLQRGE